MNQIIPIVLGVFIGIGMIIIRAKYSFRFEIADRILSRIALYRTRIASDQFRTSESYAWIADDLNVLVEEFSIKVGGRRGKSLKGKYQEYTHLEEIEYNALLNMFSSSEIESSHRILNGFMDEFETILKDDFLLKVGSRLRSKSSK